MHLSYRFVDCSLLLLDLFIERLPDCSKAVLELCLAQDRDVSLSEFLQQFSELNERAL